MWCVLLFLSGVVSAQDVLFYSSSVSLNGTDAKILVENDTYCLTAPFQFNGSSELFLANRTVWTKGLNGVYTKPRSSYAAFLNNPTLPVFTNWWVFPCSFGDASGIISSSNYIPLNATHGGTVASCSLKLPVVYACEGNVPSTQSPTQSPTRNPTQPTRLPTKNPTQSPTRQPTKVPTTSDANNVKVGGFLALVVVTVAALWLA